jgi:hypothetical protein
MDCGYRTKEVIMSHIHRFRYVIGVVVTFACSMLGIALAAPAAFAMRLPASGGTSAAVSGQSAPIVAHTTPAGGMPGWEITLIAIGAAVLTATLAVLMDRSRVAHRRVGVSAA